MLLCPFFFFKATHTQNSVMAQDLNPEHLGMTAYICYINRLLMHQCISCILLLFQVEVELVFVTRQVQWFPT